MALSDRQLLDSLSRMPFIDSAELAGILGEPHATVHRALTGLLAHGIVGRVNHGTAHLPSSQRYYLTANGTRHAAELLGFATPSDFVRAYPVSREWLTLLIRRMDGVAVVYCLAASLSPGIDGPVASRVPPQGPLRHHHHAPRRPQLRRGAPGPGPAVPVSLRPEEGHSRRYPRVRPGAAPTAPCPRARSRDLCRADGHCTASTSNAPRPSGAGDASNRHCRPM